MPSAAMLRAFSSNGALEELAAVKMPKTKRPRLLDSHNSCLPTGDSPCESRTSLASTSDATCGAGIQPVREAGRQPGQPRKGCRPARALPLTPALQRIDNHSAPMPRPRGRSTTQVCLLAYLGSIVHRC